MKEESAEPMIKHTRRATAMVVAMVSSCCFGQTASEVAKQVQRPEGAPRLSDVSMRLFRKKKDSAELSAARAFHITRADWSYIKDADYIKRVHDLGWTFQGTMNAVTHNPEHAKRDKNGKLVLDHFGKPGRYWADNDNESYRQWYLEQMNEWIAVGADSMQRDEPTTCRRTPVPDAARFLREMHKAFEKRLGRHVPISCNLAWNNCLFGGKGEPVAMLFDFGMAELGRDKVRPDFLWQASRDVRSRGKAMVYTSYHDLGVELYRLAIAGCYATGLHFIVPWDQYGGVNKPRVFSRARDQADLYGFVRANAPFLDGYEDAAAIGYRLEDARWGKPSILSVTGADRVSAFVRAKPGDTAAPVVVHLIDWGKPKAFRIRLRPAAFFRTVEVVAALHSPSPFDARAHEKAETSGDYAPLSRTKELRIAPDGDWRIIEVPALTPWGMLVISQRPAEMGATNGD